MIITKLQGGLGNQMFQYAAARGIRGGKRAIAIDKSFYDENISSSDTFTARAYELNIFKNLEIRPLNTFEKIIYKSSNKNSDYSKIFKPALKIIKQQENEYIDGIKDNWGLIYLDGYFQSEKYFFHIKSNLKHELSFAKLEDESSKVFLDNINAIDNSVCVHVRRGDYLKLEVLKYHGLLPLDYYIEAIKKVESQIDQPHFFIFSDDLAWCNENFKNLNFSFTLVNTINKGRNSWKDMCLMSYCKHHIVANSSFSWWGAWLSNKSGLKIAPYNWFNPAVANFNIADIIPASWHILNYD